jgi:tetratricopeptide (TPR) repeat protein
MKLRFALATAPFAILLCLEAPSAKCQDSGDQGLMIRGDRAEISITVREASGSIITVPVSVTIYYGGMPVDRSSTSHGRAFYIPPKMGDYTVVVEGSGYKTAQKDVSVAVSDKIEVDVVLQRELASNESVGVPGRPILAPDAQKALSKGMQALRDGKLEEAEKELSKAANLAPSNPDVLYIQGMLYMKQTHWDKAETVLQKADQVEPNQPKYLSALGMAYCNEGKYEPAIASLEKSVQLQPEATWETSYALGKAYYYRKMYDQALKMAEQAHTTSHGASPQAELLLAQCLSAVGRYEDAAQVLREFLKSNGQVPEAVTAQRWLDNLTTAGKIRP